MGNSLIKDLRTNILNINNKSILGVDDADINQIVPIKYRWAIESFEIGCANNWMPNEVPMDKDLSDWITLTEAEKRLILICLGFIGTAESLIANNIVHSVYKYITNPECRQYLLRQGYEEALHTWTFMYITESLSIDQDMIFNMHKNLDVIKEKDEFAMKMTSGMSNNSIDTSTTKGIQELILNLVGFYVIVEGIYFYGGFPVLLAASSSSNKMNGLAKQIQFIMRDESVHLNFGIDLINTIKEEHPEAWTKEFQQEITNMIRTAVDYEAKYLEYILEEPVFGITVTEAVEAVKFYANRRLEKIGLQVQYPGAVNKLENQSALVDIAAEENFFEQRVTSYRVDQLDF